MKEATEIYDLRFATYEARGRKGAPVLARLSVQPLINTNLDWMVRVPGERGDGERHEAWRAPRKRGNTAHSKRFARFVCNMPLDARKS